MSTKVINKVKSTPRAVTGRSKPSPSTSISFQLLDAVNALRNNECVRSIEYKDPMDGKLKMEKDVTYPPELIKGMRGMFPASKTYSFEIHASTTNGTSGGGVFNTTIPWNPASFTYAEWSALSALFDEVVLCRSQIDITSAFGPTSTAIIFQICIAPDVSGSAGGTPSFTTTQRIAESEFFHCYLMAKKPGVFTKVKKGINKTRPYALTSTPGGASGTPSGCLGAWCLSSNIVGTPTTNYIFSCVKNVVRLRNRA